MVLVSLLLPLYVNTAEYIQLFTSDITVHKDASLMVRETITVHAEGDAIRRGIVREFPTRYDLWNSNHSVGFDLKTVLLDGESVPYHVASADNGKKIYIGDPAVFLIPGKTYTYTIEYVTNRQMVFFEDHDELYWNVTGNGWRLPIKKVMATVHLPTEVPHESVLGQAFTGYQGSAGQDYVVQIKGSDIEFVTTRPFYEYEGLTIAVSLPKGFIMPPSTLQVIKWFLKDNGDKVLLFLGLLSLLSFYVILFIKLRKNRPQAAIIPLFYPPNDMLPGAVCYFKKMKYTNTVLTSDLVNMGVQGLLTIGYSVKSATYFFKKNPKKDTHELYARIYDQLFLESDTVILKIGRYDHTVQRLASTVERYYKDQLHTYFNFNTTQVCFSIALAGLFILGIGGISYVGMGIFAALVYGAIIGGAYYFLRGYTYEGWIIRQQIDGFEMFLEAIEKERLKIVGTPPLQTPELYETYLPYAIALGVEEAWSNQFAPLFKKLENEGHPYKPYWYTGYMRGYNMAPIASDISRSLNTHISSSASVPGKSSGFGGGSSGAGGGGGGGGGW